jgi:hypothetical protein
MQVAHAARGSSASRRRLRDGRGRCLPAERSLPAVGRPRRWLGQYHSPNDGMTHNVVEGSPLAWDRNGSATSAMIDGVRNERRTSSIPLRIVLSPIQDSRRVARRKREVSRSSTRVERGTSRRNGMNDAADDVAAERCSKCWRVGALSGSNANAVRVNISSRHRPSRGRRAAIWEAIQIVRNSAWTPSTSKRILTVRTRDSRTTTAMGVGE